MSKWLLAAPRSAFCPAACVSLARRRLCRNLRFDIGRRGSASSAHPSGDGPSLTPGRWPGKIPPDGTVRPDPRRQMIPDHSRSLGSPRRIFRRGLFQAPRAPVCVPLRHARVSGGDGEPVRTFPPSASRGGRPLQRPGLSTCDSRRPRRRSRLAGLRMVRCIRWRNGVILRQVGRG